MFRTFVAIAMAGFLSGCASTIGTFYNRPVVEDSVETSEKGILSTMSLSADRRTVIVVTKKGGGTGASNEGKFCAEPPPDAATAMKTDLNATLKVPAKADLIVADKFETSVTVLADRTAALDMFRTGVYALCQYNLNGSIKDSEVQPMFIKLIDAFVAVNKVENAEIKATEAELAVPAAKAKTETAQEKK